MSSIRSDLNFYLLLGPGLILVVTGFLLERGIETQLKASYDEALFERAEGLITLTKDFGDRIELDFADEFMPGFSKPEGPEFFEIWLKDGTLLERSHSLQDRPLNPNWRPGSRPRFEDITVGAGIRCRLATITFVPQNERLNSEGHMNVAGRERHSVTLLLARDREPFDKMLFGLRGLVSISFGVLILVLLIMVQKALKKGLTPLEDIRKQVEELNPENLDQLVHQDHTPDELVPVVHQLNNLLSKLREVLARERQMTKDIAHQLRTPITELFTLSEVALSYKTTGNPKSILQEVNDIAGEMGQTISNLLALSRYDSGSQVVFTETLLLNQLIVKYWNRGMNNVTEKGLQFYNGVPPDTTIISDPFVLEQILQNILHNAAAYTPEGGEVRVDFNPQDDSVLLSFSNPAPGLEQDDLQHMFDRFWRKDASRTGGDHSGLGLALVRAFIHLLNWEVKAELNGTILTISIVIPQSAFEEAPVLQ